MPPVDVAPSRGLASLRDRLTWRRLGGAWAALALLAGGGAGVLQWLGAPQERAGMPASAAFAGPSAGTGAAVPRDDAGTRAGAMAGVPEAVPPRAAVLQGGPSSVATSTVATSPAGVSATDMVQPAAPHDLASAVATAAAGPALLHASGGPDRRGLPEPAPASGVGGAQAAQGAASEDMAGATAAAGATSALPGAEPGAVTGPVAGLAAVRGGDGAPARHSVGLPAQAQDGPVVIAAPLAALLEPGPDGLSLPQVGADGLAPMQAYARPFSAPPGAKLVAVVLDGVGLSEADSLAAINALPGAIDLAVSPYAAHPDALLRQARLKGHELLVSIPMEPAGSPLNDEGGRALSTDASEAANAAGLDRVLGRIQGYAGATGGSDGQRGERFALSGRPFAEVARDLAARGLLYVDAAGARLPPELASRGVDLVVDEPEGAAVLDARLARLEAMAQENGTALGLAGPPRPVTVARIALWAKGLAARGLVLAPASALARAGRAAPSGRADELLSRRAP